MDETSFSSQSGPPLEADGAFPNIYAILFDEVKDEEMDFIHEVTHEDTEMELVCEVNENEVTGEVNDFLGFTDEEIELSRDKAMIGWQILIRIHYGVVEIIKICSFL